jgi:sugar phosphate isomerase/epimerase
MLQLGYTTYAMRDEDVFDAVPGLVDIGYEAIELVSSEGYQIDPDEFDAADRERLVALYRDLDLPAPHLMDLSVTPLASEAHSERTFERMHAVCALASDLRVEDGRSVVKFPMTGDQPEWEGNERWIRDRLVDLADVAAEYDVVFAPEPHVGTCFESPDKAAWLMSHTDHDNLRLALDISHFPAAVFDVDRAVDLCAPHAVSTHVKDTDVVDGEFRFALPGDTDFDYEWYLKRLVDEGYAGPINAEVSAQIWDEPGHDPWAAARRMYESLEGPIAAANRYAEEST